jgi:hypothetical protein
MPVLYFEQKSTKSKFFLNILKSHSKVLLQGLPLLMGYLVLLD